MIVGVDIGSGSDRGFVLCSTCGGKGTHPYGDVCHCDGGWVEVKPKKPIPQILVGDIVLEDAFLDELPARKGKVVSTRQNMIKVKWSVHDPFAADQRDKYEWLTFWRLHWTVRSIYRPHPTAPLGIVCIHKYPPIMGWRIND